MIASGREFNWEQGMNKDYPDDVEEPYPKGNFTYLQQQVNKWTAPEVALLVQRFVANPPLVRSELVKELGLGTEYAANLFAMVLFWCNGLVRSKPTMFSFEMTRFFNIAQELPMEL